MQSREAGQSSAGLVGLVRGIVENRLFQVVVPLVGEVVSQNVLDEALLDGLAHRVQVEGMMLAVGAFLAEEFQGPALGSGGECEERQVGLPSSRRYRLSQ